MEIKYELHKALGDENRYKIVNILLTHDYCVGALARKLNISTGAVSQHLQILRTAGIVKGEKRGYWTHYSVDKDVLRKIASSLEEMTGLSRSLGSCDVHTEMDCNSEHNKHGRDDTDV